MKQQNTLAENLNKLPNWAQTEIRVLQMRLQEANKKISELIEAPVSNTVCGYTRPWDNEDKVMYLPNNQLITFILDNEKELQVRIEKGALNVHAVGTFRGLKILPRASNVVEIEFNQ